MTDKYVALVDKIGAVIITFNPDKDFEKNLAAIKRQLNKVIVVDNGSEQNTLIRIKECVALNSNIILIENGDNLGIAEALNIGCQYLLEHNMLYALLLDQDSLVTQGMVGSLSNTILLDKKCAVVGPQILNRSSEDSEDLIPSRYMVPSNGIFYSKASIENQPLKVLFNITSGSLIDLAIWTKIGKFQEDYFIEGVDNEYGLRANNLGYSVVVDHNASLLQQYGNQRIIKAFGKHFFPTFHSPLRHYYVSRNRIMIWKKYYKKYPYYLTWDLLSFGNTIFLIIAFENNRLEKLKFMIKGILDAFKGKKGKYSC